MTPPLYVRMSGRCSMPRWRHPLMSGSLVAIMLAAGLVAQTALRVLDVRTRKEHPADQHAAGAERREMDAGAAVRRVATLSPGSGRVPRRRVYALVRGACRRRHTAATDLWEMERRCG